MPNRSHASILVENGGSGTLIDCGEGAVQSLLKQSIDPHHIDRIVISHTHPDHCSGIPLLMQYMHLTEREENLLIHLPLGVGTAFKRYFQQVYLLNEKLTFDYTIWEYGEGAKIISEGLLIEPIPNRHLEGLEKLAGEYRIAVPSFSLVFSHAGKSVYYSADLMDAEDLNPPSKVDLMIVEITHISIADALKKAAEKGIKRVILTHIPPEMEGVSIPSHKGVKAELAGDGMVLDI